MILLGIEPQSLLLMASTLLLSYQTVNFDTRTYSDFFGDFADWEGFVTLDTISRRILFYKDLYHRIKDINNNMHVKKAGRIKINRE